MNDQAKTKAMERRDELGRWSILPNSILIEIFSFLDTKQAVQSCVLSKQWLKFWTLLPDLDFDSSHFRNLTSFDEFVNMVLTRRDTSVPIRGIKFRRSVWCRKLSKKMIEYAVSHSDTLRIMKLDNFVLDNLVLEHQLCLKQLVSLYLSDVSLCSFLCCQNSSREIFSGCPNLEQLTLLNCPLYEKFLIVAPQLSTLYLDVIYGSEYAKVVLSTPKLIFLKSVSNIPCISQPDGLPLLEAIEINLDYTYGQAVHEEKHMLDLIPVLKCFFNVKRMRLSYRVIQILSELLNVSAQEPSPFCNMEVLNIIPSWRCKSFTIPVHLITYLLGNSPHAKIVVEKER